MKAVKVAGGQQVAGQQHRALLTFICVDPGRAAALWHYLSVAKGGGGNT